METEIKIKVPEGMEIDKQNSTFECIKFRPKKVTYEDIQNTFDYVLSMDTTFDHHQACVTFRKLLEVADYLNGDWKPNWNDVDQRKYFIYYNHNKEMVDIDYYYRSSYNAAYFSSRENALKAIEIIGEEKLKKFFL